MSCVCVCVTVPTVKVEQSQRGAETLNKHTNHSERTPGRAGIVPYSFYSPPYIHTQGAKVN